MAFSRTLPLSHGLHWYLWAPENTLTLLQQSHISDSDPDPDPFLWLTDPDPGGWIRIRIRTLIETKAQNVQISKLRIETKPKRFDMFQNLKWNISIYSKNFGTKPKLFDVFQLLFCKSKTFLFFPKILEQNQNFLMCSNFFLAKAKRYCLIQKLRNKTKTFWFSSQFSKTKTEHFEVSKKI